MLKWCPLFLNTNDKRLLIKIVQTGTKKSAVNVSKLQGTKGSWTSWPHTVASEKSVVLFSACQTKRIPFYHDAAVTRGMDLVFYISFIKANVPVLGIVHLKKSKDFFKALVDQIIRVITRYNSVFPFSLYSLLWSA